MKQPQANLRTAFKRAARRKDRGDHFMSLCAEDIAQLSAAQVLKLIRFAQSPAFEVYETELQMLALESLHKGVLNNEYVRDWHDGQLFYIRSITRADTRHVWSGDIEDMPARMEESYEGLRDEKSLKDFFMLRGFLQNIVAERFRDAGLVNLRNWPQDRFMRSLFPRMKSLRKKFQLHGADTDTKLLVPFRDRVGTAYGRLPDYMRDFLHSSGYTFRIARRLGQIDPDYARREAAHEPGTTYEQSACGVCVDDLLCIDLPECVVEKVKANRTREVYAHMDFQELAITTGHEAGHALLNALGDFAQRDPKIRIAYAADLADIRASSVHDTMTKLYSYYLPKTHGGKHESIDVAREEALVEIMSELMLRKSGMLGGELYIFMPRVSNIALNLLETLRIDYEVDPTGNSFPNTAALDALARQPYKPETAMKLYAFGL